MAFFAKTNDPLKTIKHDIAEASGLRDKQIALAVRETAGAAATATATALASDGADDDSMKAAEADVRAAADLLVRRQAAVSDSNTKLAELERERDAVLDKQTRAATAVEIKTTTSEFESAGQQTGACHRQAGHHRRTRGNVYSGFTRPTWLLRIEPNANS